MEVIHKVRPDFFQLSPSMPYTESTNPAGEHVITVASLGPREYFTLQILSYKTVPQLLNIRSKDGPGVQIPIVSQRVYPRWLNATAATLLLLGLGLALYGLTKLVLYVLTILGLRVA